MVAVLASHGSPLARRKRRRSVDHLNLDVGAGRQNVGVDVVAEDPGTSSLARCHAAISASMSRGSGRKNA